MSELANLFDTNTISELFKDRPNPTVLSLVAASDARSYLSALTIGELRRGAMRLGGRDQLRAVAIDRWIDGLETNFGERILPVDAVVAHRWAAMPAGRSRPVIDTLIAATAYVHNLTVVTRNEADFSDLGLRIINPWA